ncbi:uncharacterized protein [Engystomops pustulosus]|uniref:uncharacterized protein n=1 Tax=Engystomops pustulosus TaxID=76066 RepID=UPI003AFB0049
MCFNKLPESYKKPLCRDCLDSIMREEKASFMDEMRSMFKSEVKSTVASLFSEGIPPKRFKPSEPNPEEMDSDPDRASCSYQGGEEEQLDSQEQKNDTRFLFPMENLDTLLRAVRETLNIEDPVETKSVQDKLFGCLKAKKKRVFPVNNVLEDLIREEWKDTHIKYRRFKMESLKSTTPLIPKGAALCTIDLKDAYYHVPIHPISQKFLRFAIRSPENQVRHFQFRALPFGISSAPRLFTKIMAEVVAVLRQRNILLIPYLDDLLLISSSEEILLSQRDTTIAVLENLGWIINFEKSNLQPSTRLKFLGILLDSVHQYSLLPEEKIKNLTLQVSLFQSRQKCSIREAMKLLGLLTSCIAGVPWAQNHKRDLQNWILSSWDKNLNHLEKKTNIPLGVKSSLNWWKTVENLSRGLKWSNWPVTSILTDASRTGWGAKLPGKLVQGQWSQSEVNRSSNYKELKAVWETLKACSEQVQGQNFKILSDNTTTVAYLKRQGGTQSASLQKISKKIFLWAEENVLSLTAVHLKGSENKEADFLSRYTLDPHEWCLNKEVFSHLTQKWGIPQIDLFATRENKKADHYFSLQKNTPDYLLDAFCHSWHSRLAYAFPPLPLISRTVQKIRQEDLKIILIVPFWPKRSWFPALKNLALEEPIILPQRKDLLYQGSVHHPNPESLHLSAWILRNRC